MPKSPKPPSLGGTNGSQLAPSTYQTPTPTNSASAISLSATIALFARVDSRVPR